MTTYSRIFVLIGVSILGLGGCTRSPNLSIINRSTAELTNVVATGSGFTKSTGSIPAGQQQSISVSPRGESDLKLEFDANGKHFKSVPQGYFESGSNTNLTATVSSDFSVIMDTKR
jgi:hypothetical protein